MRINQQTKQTLLTVIGVAIILALLALLALSGGNLDLLKNIFAKDLSNEELGEQLEELGWRGHLAITILAALQVTCTVLPAEPIQVLAGFTFGFSVGLTCCVIGVLLGNTVIYLLQKSFGNRIRGFFVKKLDLDFNKIAASGNAVLVIFILYFLPVIPYGMICFLAACMGMSYKRYIAVTGIASIPTVCIGVSLGYMAIATDWIISVCVFGALFVVAAIIFWKQAAMVAWLNRFAEKRTTKSKNTVRKVNGVVMTLVYYVARLYLLLCGVKIKTVNKIGKPESPAIILCNHGSFIDFIYAAALLHKYKPHFIVARLYFYHNILGWLLRQVGAFPKSMFAMDLENAKNCLAVLKNNGILAMMPEARLSTAGRFEDIQESTYSFIKKSGVNVYTIKINGDYLADPKWGRGFRRGSVVEAELDILYTAEQLKSLSPEEMKQGLESRLSYDEFRWLQQRPKIHYRSARMAEGLENILTTCPICGREHTLTTKKEKIFCENCGYLTSLNDRYTFTDDFQFRDLTQWYDWQMRLLQKEITGNADYTLSTEVELRLPGNGNSLTRHGGNGTCVLNRHGLTYTGTKDGEEVELHFSLQRIYRLLFGAGENFEIYDGTEILYFVPEEKRSAVQWYMASMILHDETSAT